METLASIDELRGLFRFERELGHGTYGTVFLAIDSTGRRCALKTSRLPTASAVRAFEEENRLQALAALHGLAPQCYGYKVLWNPEYEWKTNGVALGISSMELFDGTLLDLVQDALRDCARRRRDDPRYLAALNARSRYEDPGIATVRRLLEPVMKLIAALHSMRIMHGDCVPLNILHKMEDGRRRFVLGDFGFAQQFNCDGSPCFYSRPPHRRMATFAGNYDIALLQWCVRSMINKEGGLGTLELLGEADYREVLQNHGTTHKWQYVSDDPDFFGQQKTPPENGTKRPSEESPTHLAKRYCPIVPDSLRRSGTPIRN